jgi:NADH-quinone oxidoreductase subunit J
VTQLLFFIAAIGALGGAVGVVAMRDPFYAVLALVVHLLSLAILFLLLRAEFVAAAQVVVYAGAVMVLYVFVVSYVGAREEPEGRRGLTGGPIGSGLRGGGALFGGALLVELFIAVLGSGLKSIGGKGAPFVAGFGSPQQIGQLLLTRFLLAFEVASFLLLIAAVGAVVLARRRRGLPGEEEGISVLEMIRPAGTGTMREGVRGLALGAGGRGGAAQADSEPMAGLEPVGRS